LVKKEDSRLRKSYLELCVIDNLLFVGLRSWSLIVGEFGGCLSSYKTAAEKEREVSQMTQSNTASLAVKSDSQTVLSLNYQLIRTTTSPDEHKSGVQSYVVNLPAEEIASLGTEGNLRSYIGEYSPSKRNRVHEAINETIETAPERFITRNSGFVIAADDIEVDDKSKIIKLRNANIINGAQSQGEIIRYLKRFSDDGEEFATPFYVRAEIIIDSDKAEVVETAIARNTATPVKDISQAGKRGHLDDLQESLERYFPNEGMKKSETDTSGIDPVRVLQYSRLLMPQPVSDTATAAETLRAYKNPSQCLTDFSKWYEDWKSYKTTGGNVSEEKKVNARKYEFTVAIAPYALAEYRYWNEHDGWNGQRLFAATDKGRAVRRDKRTKKITMVAPGILFPLIGAMSEFVVEEGVTWKISKPPSFKPDDMIAATIKQFRAHGSDPMLMGRSESAYEALRLYPQTLMFVLKEMKKSANQ
jgi:hypothetical protein